MARLIDANIVLRWVTHDVRHPKYKTCIRELEAGGVIPLYVLPEVAFGCIGAWRKASAFHIARDKGEKEQYNSNPRCYVCEAKMPPVWRKKAAFELRERIYEALRAFPNLKFQYWDLVEVALGRMVEPGHDCVDCLLYAESILGSHEAVSVDKHLSDVIKVPAQVASKSIGKMDLS